MGKPTYLFALCMTLSAFFYQTSFAAEVSRCRWRGQLGFCFFASGLPLYTYGYEELLLHRSSLEDPRL